MTRLDDKTNARARRHGGFSLVELMVAMALSLILLGGVLAIFASSRKTYETTDRLSRIQESGRFALDVIVRDLRSAGYIGCSRRAPLTNALGVTEGTAAEDSLLWDFEVPVQGFDAQGDEWVPALNVGTDWGASGAVSANGAGDALVIRGPRGEFEPVRVTTGMADYTDPVTVAAAPALLEAGDIVLISDCDWAMSGRTIFQITANNAGVLEHADAAASTGPAGNLPGNSTTELSGAFTFNAELVPMQSVVYYLGPNTSTAEAEDTSLWRRVSGSGVAEELVEGVEALQVLYGENTGSAAAPEIEYRPADEVDDWQSVTTVRIALLVRSLSEYGTEVGLDNYNLLGLDIPNPGDRHMRQVFQTTVNLRNSAI
jgi:type IV pilus assembly protein PilW